MSHQGVISEIAGAKTDIVDKDGEDTDDSNADLYHQEHTESEGVNVVKAELPSIDSGRCYTSIP